MDGRALCDPTLSHKAGKDGPLDSWAGPHLFMGEATRFMGRLHVFMGEAARFMGGVTRVHGRRLCGLRAGPHVCMGEARRVHGWAMRFMSGATRFMGEAMRFMDGAIREHGRGSTCAWVGWCSARLEGCDFVRSFLLLS